MSDEAAFKQLLNELIRAAKAAARNRPGSRFRGYMMVAMAFDVYLGKLHAPPAARGVLGDLRNDLHDAARRLEGGSKQGARKSTSETQRMALASAIVSELMKRKVDSDAAVRKVAGFAGLNAKKLRSFRNNLNRGLKDDFANKIYKLYCETFAKEKATEDAMLTMLRVPH